MEPKSFKKAAALFMALSLACGGFAEGIWQWSVPMDKGHVFLWIPPTCQQIRGGGVVGQNNKIEQGILEHTAFRETLAELGMAPAVDNITTHRLDIAGRLLLRALTSKLNRSFFPRSFGNYLRFASGLFSGSSSL